MRMACSIALLLVLSTIAFAQDEESKCDGTTYDMSVCLSKIHKNVDSELNSVYRQALKAFSDNYRPQDVENLRTAQRRWIAYRDADCRAEYGLWGGGSGGPNANLICLIKRTRQRLADLRGMHGMHELSSPR